MIIDPENLTLEAIVRHLQPAGKSVLEVGCGDGRLSSQLCRKTARLTAVDLDREALVKARQQQSDIAFALVSGENLAFAPESFDAVVFTLSLHHQNGTAALQEAARVVRPGGTILIVEPAPDGEVEQLCNVFDDETEALAQAMRIVASSNLATGPQEIIRPRWKCADGEALIDWLFDHYSAPYDQRKADAVTAILGRRWNTSPLLLHDKLAVISLYL